MKITNLSIMSRVWDFVLPSLIVITVTHVLYLLTFRSEQLMLSNMYLLRRFTTMIFKKISFLYFTKETLTYILYTYVP